MKAKPKCSLFAALARGAFAALLLLALPLPAADHRDAPAIDEDPRADINDIYVFVNPNNGNIVLGMTVNPFQYGGAPAVDFSPDVLYQFKIDNDGDYKEDLVIQAAFSSTQPSTQSVTIYGPAAPPQNADTIASGGAISLRLPESTKLISGPANDGSVTSTNGVKVFAGPRDDPFFFDLVYIFRALGFQPGGPLTSRPPGIDFFAGVNVSIWAVELPASMLTKTPGKPIHVWSTTSRSKITIRAVSPGSFDRNPGEFVQIEAMALPVVNTVLILRSKKDEFNRATPLQQSPLYRQHAITNLSNINGDVDYSATIVDQNMPDVLTLDVTKTTGYPNGRRPQDDVIDLVLSNATNGFVTGDSVSANDVPFLKDFPFFAPAHANTEAIPPHN
ncbi:MAG TPA: DUF4331 family protein [Candidatus Limnocylindria bacterium]|nr:DUF4331 family protein [Candidatus Limnocylindria bacterium]